MKLEQKDERWILTWGTEPYENMTSNHDFAQVKKQYEGISHRPFPRELEPAEEDYDLFTSPLGIEARMKTQSKALAKARRDQDAYQRFLKFHKENPQVFDKLLDLAYEVRDSRGTGSQYGFALIYNRLRWDYSVTKTIEGELKLNNDFAPYYSRLIMQYDKSLSGMFATRTSIADGALGYSADYHREVK